MSDINSNFIDFLGMHNICIPMIQRDYVQGSSFYSSKRDEFLDSLLMAITDVSKPCNLDFIYGSTKGGRFLPLDGQQRLTTLFLLHWYLIARNMHNDKESTMQIAGVKVWEEHKFEYETRLSSSAFCTKLKLLKEIDGKELVSRVIKEQPWFSDSWLLAPSVVSMLELLDSLNNKVNGVLAKGVDLHAMLSYLLETKCVNFDQLDMGKFKLTDSLYVKMNGRGKQLTVFENWKARFIQLLENKYSFTCYEWSDEKRKDYAKSLKDYFAHSIEHEWTDLFWNYAKTDYKERFVKFSQMSQDEQEANPLEGPLIDSLFTNYYNYILKLCYYEITADSEVAYDEKQEKDLLSNSDVVKFIFWTLDFFAGIGNIKSFFEELLYLNTKDEAIAKSKTKLFLSDEPDADIFRMVIANKCSVDNQVLLFLLLKYCKQNKVDCVDENLRRYVRWCRNYLEDKNQRLTVDMKMHSNVRLNDLSSYLSDAGAFIKAPAGLKAALEDDVFILMENSGYLHGYLKAFDLANPNLAIDFFMAFRSASNIEKMRLLVAYGFTGADWGWCAHGTRHFFGNGERWDTLFRHAATAKALKPILTEIAKDYASTPDISKLIDTKLCELVSKREYSFAYYIIKYRDFAESSVWWRMDDGKSGLHFFAYANEFDVITISQYNSRPLNAYHTDPYACVVAQYFRHNYPDLYNDLDYTSRYSDKAWITYKGNNVLYFTSDGFTIIDCIGERHVWVGKNQDRIDKAIDELKKYFSIQ